MTRLPGARALPGVLAALVATLACTPAGRPSGRGSEAPEAILERAIERAGGAAALERGRALLWEGDAVVHAGGRTIPITGEWSVQPPDTAVVATYAVAAGPSTRRALVLAAPRGWTVRDGEFTPLPTTMLANERESFYLYEVLRLVPLRAPGVTLTRVPDDSLGQRGIGVRQPGRPDVDVHVDATGRVAHLRTTVTDAETGAPVSEDVWLDGTIESEGVRWPRSLRITLRGAPYFDLTLRTLRVQRELRDTLLAGPR